MFKIGFLEKFVPTTQKFLGKKITPRKNCVIDTVACHASEEEYKMANKCL